MISCQVLAHSLHYILVTNLVGYLVLTDTTGEYIMKMPNRQLDKATAGKKDMRSTLLEPYLDTEHERIVATNGHILAVCPVELDENDTSGTVSSESIKAALKIAPERARRDKTANVKANGSLVLENGATFPRESNGPFPQIDRVIPDTSVAEMVISFDAKLLKELADAINTPGTSVIKLHIKDNNSAFYVESDDMSDCYGVIMPCRVK